MQGLTHISQTLKETDEITGATPGWLSSGVSPLRALQS